MPETPSPPRSIGRSILAVFAGGAAATIIMLLIQNVGINLFPPPADLLPDLSSPDKAVKEAAYRKLILMAPTGALLCVLFSYLTGTLTAGWITARLAPRRPLMHAAMIGACLLGGGVLNFSLLPHPTWMVVIGVAIFMPAALLGGWLASRHSPKKTVDSDTGSD